MKAYIAAPWGHREAAQQAAEKLEARGITITHRWWMFEADDTDHEKIRELAILDLDGIVAADFLVVLNIEKSEGKAVEFGIALALRKPILLVGERSNIFHHILYDGFVLASIDDAVRYMG